MNKLLVTVAFCSLLVYVSAQGKPTGRPHHMPFTFSPETEAKVKAVFEDKSLTQEAKKTKLEAIKATLTGSDKANAEKLEEFMKKRGTGRPFFGRRTTKSA